MKEEQTELKKRYLAVNFMGLAMIGSVFVYALVVEILKRALAPFTGFASLDQGAAHLLTYALMFLSLGIYFVIRVIRKKLVAQSPSHLPQAAIITFALCEAVAVFGLVLFLLTGNSLDFYLFFAFSLFLFYIYFPKYDNWEKIMGLGPSSPPRHTP